MEQHRFDKRFPNLKRNIFIVTYGRSGSTLLQRMIQTIPGCTIRGENNNVMETIWRSATRIRKTRADWGKSAQPELSPWHGADLVRPHVFAAGMVDSMVNSVLMPPKDARYFGFKEIRYVRLGNELPKLLDFMRTHFKDAFFVFNTRSADDVMKSRWWKNKEPQHVRTMVETSDRLFAEYHAAHPEFTELLKYEEFSNDPEALRGVFDKLGEDFNPKALRAIMNEKLVH